jgi:hypothetical protein
MQMFEQTHGYILLGKGFNPLKDPQVVWLALHRLGNSATLKKMERLIIRDSDFLDKAISFLCTVLVVLLVIGNYPFAFVHWFVINPIKRLIWRHGALVKYTDIEPGTIYWFKREGDYIKFYKGFWRKKDLTFHNLKAE